MPRPEILGDVEREPVVTSWSQNAAIAGWKVKPRSRREGDEMGVLGKRAVCEETGADLEPLLPGDFMTSRLQGVLRILEARDRNERAAVGVKMLPASGESSRSVRRKVMDIVRTLEERIAGDEAELESLAMRLKAEIRALEEGGKAKRVELAIQAQAEEDAGEILATDSTS